MAWKAVITNAGMALLDQYAQGGHTLHLLGATVASGTVADANMRIQTALTTEKDSASIISAVAITGGTKFKVQVGPASASVGAYTAHQLGLWAKLDNGARTLLALAQDADDGVGVPLASVSPTFAFALFITVAMSNTGTLSVTIDETAFITLDTLNTALALKVDVSDIDDTAGSGDTDKLWSADKLAGEVDDLALRGILFGTCMTAAATQGKVVSCDGFVLKTGAMVIVSFSNTNTASNPTMNVNSTGAKSIYYRGAAITAGYLAANHIYLFRYNGTQYDLVGDVDTSSIGTVVGVKMNGTTNNPDNNGIVDLGTVITDISGKADKSESLSLTATAAGWSSAEPPTQTISATGVTASNNILVGAGSLTSQQQEAMVAAQIMCTAQASGTITLTAYGEKPTIDLPIAVIILG